VDEKVEIGALLTVDADVDSFDFSTPLIAFASSITFIFKGFSPTVGQVGFGTVVAERMRRWVRRRTIDAQNLRPRSSADDELRARGKAGRAVGERIGELLEERAGWCSFQDDVGGFSRRQFYRR
jgi:hypothetical protein